MKKWLLFFLLSCIALGGLFFIEYYRFYDGKLHVIFCNVGQGDAVFIRTPSGKNILYDAGPDTSILSCLTSHMPFWDRTIHELILSHPHQDHFFGMFYVIDKYITLTFDIEDLSNETEAYKGLAEKIRGLKIPVRVFHVGDTLQIADGVRISVTAPSKTYIHKTSPRGTIGESGEFASLIPRISYGSFDLLLTGDSQAEGIRNALPSIPHKVDVLQVPHHGSKTGLDRSVIEFLDPAVAIISVGKNKYGHPSKEILRLLESRKIKTLRTDEMGDIEIVSDGKGWNVRGRRL